MTTRWLHHTDSQFSPIDLNLKIPSQPKHSLSTRTRSCLTSEMSFGWSSGDIATAVKLIYNLIQALDTCNGAAGDYREAVGCLQDLKRTFDPLQTLAALNAYPSYARGIEEQVAQIREPIESFLKGVVKFEPALGGK